MQTLAEKASSELGEQNLMDETGFGKTFRIVFLTRKECIPQPPAEGLLRMGLQFMWCCGTGDGGESGDCILNVTFMTNFSEQREQKLGSSEGKTNHFKQQTMLSQLLSYSLA